MLTPSLALYLYLFPVVAMILGTWAYTYCLGEDLRIYLLIAVAVLIVYPLWVWWWGAFPTQLDIEALALLITCFVSAIVGLLTVAITDGTW